MSSPAVSLPLEDASGVAARWRDVLRRLLPFLKPHRATLALALGLLAASTTAQLCLPLLLRRVLDVDIPARDPDGLLLTVLAYALVLGAYVVVSYFLRTRLEVVGQAVLLDLRTRLFDRLLRHSVSFHDRNPPGRLIARVQGDTDALRQLFTGSVVGLVEGGVLLVGMVVVLSMTSGRLALVVGALVPVPFLLTLVLARAGARSFRVVREKAADVTGVVAERVGAIPAIQAFGREAESVARVDAAGRSKFRAAVISQGYGAAVHQVVFICEVAGIALALWFGGRWTVEGALTLGTLVMAIEYLRRVFIPLGHLSEQVEILQRAVAAGGRVLALLDLEVGVRDPKSPRPWPGLRDAIELRGVTFSYRGDGENALTDVSLRIPRGEVHALVGPTGGGKSTVLNLLLRFHDPQHGEVLVDGTSVRDIPQSELRRHAALVLQDVHLFPGSVLRNLSPSGVVESGEHAERLKAAARLVGASDFIEKLPQGWNEPLSERGANLSAGERQLLAFARALARDPEILLLDEATSSVDPETERRIQRALHELLEGRTALIIAHRLSTIRDADAIHVVKGGRIVESGRHADLLAAGGVYASLHALQAEREAGAGGGAA